MLYFKSWSSNPLKATIHRLKVDESGPISSVEDVYSVTDGYGILSIDVSKDGKYLVFVKSSGIFHLDLTSNPPTATEIWNCKNTATICGEQGIHAVTLDSENNRLFFVLNQNYDQVAPPLPGLGITTYMAGRINSSNRLTDCIPVWFARQRHFGGLAVDTNTNFIPSSPGKYNRALFAGQDLKPRAGVSDIALRHLSWTIIGKDRPETNTYEMSPDYQAVYPRFMNHKSGKVILPISEGSGASVDSYILAANFDNTYKLHVEKIKLNFSFQSPSPYNKPLINEASLVGNMLYMARDHHAANDSGLYYGKIEEPSDPSDPRIVKEVKLAYGWKLSQEQTAVLATHFY